MTKAELRSNLLAKDWVDHFIGSEEEIGTPHTGITEYEQSVLEVVGNACIGRSIRYYVKDEGEEDEVAYYKTSDPQASIEAPA